KGLHLIGTGDALHPKWLLEIKGLDGYSDGVYEKNGCKFVITTEVEDSHRVHHLVFLPEISAAQGLQESLKKHSADIEKDGRPHVRLNGEELLDFVEEVGGFAGPSHAFVPWTSVYKEYDTIKDCYGKNAEKVGFLELGLSADTEMAGRIPELQDISFLTNSDAHSPWPNRLGREFNRLSLEDFSFPDIKKAIFGGGIKLNVGLDPRLGKYHRTACIKCYTLYKFADAKRYNWKCQDCGGRLKKGVYDRIEELSACDTPGQSKNRPDYIRIAPLADILSSALGVKNVYSDRVQNAWRGLVERFKTEIAVLLDVPVEGIKTEGGEKLADLISAYRQGRFNILEGGGGKYGEMLFSRKNSQNFYTGNQSMLDSFVR
ncbi:MAG: TIGR00375 family protein, partial [Candidatus Hydrothermarchaeaceae archaeon]